MVTFLLFALLLMVCTAWAAEPAKVIIDTDIGDDIDDAYAVALALASPELEIVGITTAHGATEQRARLVSRMLYEAGREDIPVVSGVPGDARRAPQFAWAEHFRHARLREQNVADFLHETLRAHPGQITVIAIGPLTNLGALLDRDPQALRYARQVILMGGNLRVSELSQNGAGDPQPWPEYNIKTDIAAARKLFACGVPIIMAPLDATDMLKLDESKRLRLWKHTSPLTDALTVLYHLWGDLTPTLYDPLTIAMAVAPTFAQLRAMHIEVDERGVTHDIPGKPANARVCLHPDQERFWEFVLGRLEHQELRRTEERAAVPASETRVLAATAGD